MLIDERFLFKILNGKINKCFYKIRWTNNHTKRRIIQYKEHNIHLLQRPNSRSKYGIVDVIKATIYTIKNVPDELISSCGYKNRDDFYTWCKSWHSLTEDDEIGLVEFELHTIMRHGKELFTTKNIPIPKVMW